MLYSCVGMIRLESWPSPFVPLAFRHFLGTIGNRDTSFQGILLHFLAGSCHEQALVIVKKFNHSKKLRFCFLESLSPPLIRSAFRPNGVQSLKFRS